MNRVYFMIRILLLTGLIISLFSCKEDHHSPFDDPPWLGGSIIETLEGEGNYTILLDLMRKANYEEPIEKGLFTIFAANDSAYQAYFSSKGISSVDDLTEKQAQMLFTLNILNTPRSRQQLIYDYLQYHGGWQKPNSEIGALLWRIYTKGRSPEYLDEVKYFKNFLGQTLKIVGQDKLVPMLSTEFFREYNGDSEGSDYTYFFPNTPWKGLQWYNAAVTKPEAKTSNGFIYYLDRAVPEIPNIDDYLRMNQDKFSVYYDLIQRFAEYSFNTYDDDPERTRLYRKTYTRISNLTQELGPSLAPPYDRRNSFSAFIPTDDVLQKFIDETFLKSFPNLDSVPEVSLITLAQSCLINLFAIPSKIQGSLINAYGDIIPIDVYNDVVEATLLSNGPVYTMKKYYPPRAFTSTVGPVFFNNDYTTYLYGINNAKMVASLTSPDLYVNIFAPTNDGLLEGGIRYYQLRKQLEWYADDETWKAMDEFSIKEFVENHIVTNNQIDYSGEGFIRTNSGNYIYYNNNQLQGGGNQELGTTVKITGKEEGDNGVLYHLDKAILGPKKDPSRFIAEDNQLSEFFNLLCEAGAVDTIIDALTRMEYPRIKFLQEQYYWTVFAPTNNAIITARNNGLIPEDPKELMEFLRYYFVHTNVIFDDGVSKGEFETAKIDSITPPIVYYAKLQINNMSKNLELIDKQGNNVKVNHSQANNMVKTGVVHKIDKMLFYKSLD